MHAYSGAVAVWIIKPFCATYPVHKNAKACTDASFLSPQLIVC